MLLAELALLFPLHCRVSMTAAGIALDHHLVCHGTEGVVVGYSERHDLAGQAILFLQLKVFGGSRRRESPPSLWTRVV